MYKKKSYYINYKHGDDTKLSHYFGQIERSRSKCLSEGFSVLIK